MNRPQSEAQSTKNVQETQRPLNRVSVCFMCTKFFGGKKETQRIDPVNIGKRTSELV
jgi:hypothetical protein